jgi:hypothetical protein
MYADDLELKSVVGCQIMMLRSRRLPVRWTRDVTAAIAAELVTNFQLVLQLFDSSSDSSNVIRPCSI